jgi:hypothetical protein
MIRFVILTAVEADQVRGPSAVTPAAALNPIPRQAGKFILPIAVLSDPSHAAHWEFLGALPQLDLGDPAFPGEIEEE